MDCRMPVDGASPLGPVVRRLEDAHAYWHQALDAYFDPDEFRRAIQGAIQTLRTVTLVLQKQKGVLKDFDTWYTPWQAKLKSDPLLRWSIEARNYIEKEGDLEANSFVRAQIIVSYIDAESPAFDVPVQLFDSLEGLFAKLPKEVLESHVVKHGVIRIQRRWVENSLPDFELLEAISCIYEKLAELVHDAHLYQGISSPIGPTRGTIVSYRPPCMVGHCFDRSLTVSLQGGSLLELKRETIDYDHDLAEQIPMAVRTNISNIAVQTSSDPLNDLAVYFFELARTVFLHQGVHKPQAILLAECQPTAIVELVFRDQSEKYVMMRELANDALRQNADGVILINEVWMARPEDLEPYQLPSETTIRNEALILQIAARDRKPFQYLAMIDRKDGLVGLGDTHVSESIEPHIFAPFYEAWKVKTPWLDASQE